MPRFRIDELDTIYPRLAPQLEKIVVCKVGLPNAVLEEACQVAWGQLALRRPEVAPGHELPWLATTAIRAARRLMHAGRDDLSLDDEEQQEHLIELGAVVPGPESAVEVRGRLAAVLELPARQRRMVLMHGAGYGYVEIAERTGDSLRTVERQLLRAKQQLRAFV